MDCHNRTAKHKDRYAISYCQGLMYQMYKPTESYIKLGNQDSTAAQHGIIAPHSMGVHLI